jgi:predicted  nucleic acid-binding Zn-ribbon protein
MVLRKRSYLENKKGFGPGGKCVCTRCGHISNHVIGKPCDEIKCPKCGNIMDRKMSEGRLGWDPPDEEGTTDAYGEMEYALRPFKDALARSKKGSGRVVQSREFKEAMKKILRATKDATKLDMQTFIADLGELQIDVETELNRLDKKERKDPSLKKDQNWMHVAGSLTSAFDDIEEILEKLRRMYRNF